MFLFNLYTKTSNSRKNDGYYAKLEKLGAHCDLSLPKIPAEEVKEYLDKHFYNDITIIEPIRSCSVLSGYDPLLKHMSTLFGCKVFTIYGYIRTHQRKYHFFKEDDIRRAKNGAMFESHHAWMQFENGQLLDLTFLNTLRAVNNMLDETKHEYEFLLSDDGAEIKVPAAMSILEGHIPPFMHYIPMFNGKLFDSTTMIYNELRRLERESTIGVF